MNSTKITLAVVVSLLFGATLGVLAGYRHAEQRLGAEIFTMLHKQAETNLRSYERIEQLVEAGDKRRLLSYLDSIMQAEATVLESTKLSAS